VASANHAIARPCRSARPTNTPVSAHRRPPTGSWKIEAEARARHHLPVLQRAQRWWCARQLRLRNRAYRNLLGASCYRFGRRSPCPSKQRRCDDNGIYASFWQRPAAPGLNMKDSWVARVVEPTAARTGTGRAAGPFFPPGDGQSLPGFPGSFRVKAKTPMPGGRLRPRWKTQIAVFLSGTSSTARSRAMMGGAGTSANSTQIPAQHGKLRYRDGG
jgi:hypothetical protein